MYKSHRFFLSKKSSLAWNCLAIRSYSKHFMEVQLMLNLPVIGNVFNQARILGSSSMLLPYLDSKLFAFIDDVHCFTMFSYEPSVISLHSIIVVPIVNIPAPNLGIQVTDFSGTVPSQASLASGGKDTRIPSPLKLLASLC